MSWMRSHTNNEDFHTKKTLMRIYELHEWLQSDEKRPDLETETRDVLDTIGTSRESSVVGERLPETLQKGTHIVGSGIG